MKKKVITSSKNLQKWLIFKDTMFLINDLTGRKYICFEKLRES